MHPPRARFPGREHSCAWKTVSVEGIVNLGKGTGTGVGCQEIQNPQGNAQPEGLRIARTVKKTSDHSGFPETRHLRPGTCLVRCCPSLLTMCSPVAMILRFRELKSGLPVCAIWLPFVF